MYDYDMRDIEGRREDIHRKKKNWLRYHSSGLFDYHWNFSLFVAWSGTAAAPESTMASTIADRFGTFNVLDTDHSII